MFTFTDNEQIVIEIKKLLLSTKTTQRELAAIMQLTPQGLTKLFNKKNFGFEDARKILNALGYDLALTFIPRN